MMLEHTFTIQLPLSLLNKVLEALGERPYKDVAGLLGNIDQQVQAQLQQLQAAQMPQEMLPEATDSAEGSQPGDGNTPPAAPAPITEMPAQ